MTQKVILDISYNEQCELPTGKLPTEKDILCCMMYLLRSVRTGKSKRTIKDAAVLMTTALVEHWNFCNVNTIDEKHIIKKITNLYNEFKSNYQTRNKRKTEK